MDRREAVAETEKEDTNLNKGTTWHYRLSKPVFLGKLGMKRLDQMPADLQGEQPGSCTQGLLTYLFSSTMESWGDLLSLPGILLGS